jgi:hypothetical protein
MSRKKAGQTKRIISRWFKERQIYHRSDGVVHFISMSARTQIALAAALVGMLGPNYRGHSRSTGRSDTLFRVFMRRGSLRVASEVNTRSIVPNVRVPKPSMKLSRGLTHA